jgi:hypothetical protein
MELRNMWLLMDQSVIQKNTWNKVMSLHHDVLVLAVIVVD